MSRLPQDMQFLKETGEVGDCVRASTATILGISRDEVPHFVKEHEGDWAIGRAYYHRTRSRSLPGSGGQNA